MSAASHFEGPARSGVPGLSSAEVRTQTLRTGWTTALPVVAHDARHDSPGKAPAIAKWEAFARFKGRQTTPADVAAWANDRWCSAGTGIACGPVVVVDIDFKADPATGERIYAEAVAAFGETPFIRQGEAPKIALVYRAAGPMPSLALKSANGSGDGLDILAENRQLVAFGVHPDTGRPYRWIGTETPLTAGPDAAPEVTAEQIAAFVARIREFVLLVGGGGTGGGRGGDTAEIVRNAFGLVTDGREKHLRNTVYAVAQEVRKTGEDLTVEALAARAWARFSDTADLRDGNWSPEAARRKALALIKRIASGTVDLDAKPEAAEKPEEAEPTYPDTSVPLAEAQEAVEAAIGRFYVEAAAWDGRKAEHDPEEESAGFTEPPPALMLPADVGTGKTHAVGEALKAEGAGLKTVVAMPTLRLAAEAAERFRDGPGVVGRVIRGRDNVDPDAPPPEPGAKPRKMCLDIEAVNAALMIGAPVQESCCKLKTKDTAGRKINLKCQHFDVCSYQAQMRDAPNVLFAAHSMLSKGHEVFDGIQRLIIDETFVRALQLEVSKGLSLDEIGAPLTDGEIAVLRKSLARHGAVTGALLERLVADEKDAIEWRRKAIAAALRAQAAAGVLGPVRRQFLTRVPGFGEVSAALCAQAVRDAWTLKSEVQMWPGMPAAERRKAVKAGSGIKHIRARAGVAAQLRDFLALDGARAGRVFLVAQKTDHGSVTVARTHGIDRIAAPFRVPTLAIDATPPADGVLKAFLPQAEYLPRVSVQMPHVRVRQMLYAPVSKAKLEIERNRAAVRRAVLAEWVRLGRAPVLVVGQKPFADRLRSEGKLPATIAVEHYGAIAGLDQHRNVRGVICVGREQPNPWDVESIAGARTGVFPETVATPQREGATPWYGKVTRFVRMRDGSAHAVTVDEHPDPVCEATRRGICEDQIIQAIGRGRGVWRTAATPLDVMLMADVVLDLTVDEVGPWKDVREEIAMLAEGVVLASAADRATAWPAVWPSAKAAERRDQKERAARKSCPPLSYLDSILVGKGGAAFRPFRYKRNGNGQRWTEGAYDPAVVPDLRAWLEGRLGPLAGIELETAAQPNTPPAPCAQANRLPRCADHAPELSARYRLVVEREAEPFKLVPVIPEIVRWDPSQAVRWPVVPYGMKEAAA